MTACTPALSPLHRPHRRQRAARCRCRLGRPARDRNEKPARHCRFAPIENDLPCQFGFAVFARPVAVVADDPIGPGDRVLVGEDLKATNYLGPTQIVAASWRPYTQSAARLWANGVVWFTFYTYSPAHLLKPLARRVSGPGTQTGAWPTLTPDLSRPSPGTTRRRTVTTGRGCFRGWFVSFCSLWGWHRCGSHAHWVMWTVSPTTKSSARDLMAITLSSDDKPRRTCFKMPFRRWGGFLDGCSTSGRIWG